VYSHGDAWRFECSDERQRCLSNYESTLPLILHPDAPVSFFFPSLHSSASPPSRHPQSISPQLKKKTQKKPIYQIRLPTLLLSILHPTLLSLPLVFIINTPGPLISQLLPVTYLITLLQQSLAFVMGDNATEIDLDSVIDRLLEGASLLLRSRNIFYGYGSRRFSISPV
jgi:hypothetical protein